jgi:hypothetical protein
MAEPIVIECATACTATVQLEPAPPTSDFLADQGSVWVLFLGAGIAVLCLRKLYDLFDKAPHGDT